MNSKTGHPFFALFWSRDPDGTQHNQGDSLNKLTPGINGQTSRLGVANADHDLLQIFDYIQNDPSLRDNTDIIVTADHGFSTISRRDLDGSGTKFVSDYASRFTYKDVTGRQEVNTGFLPTGFVAIDIAHALALPLFDPDTPVTNNGVAYYKPVNPTVGQTSATVAQRPASGDGVIGGGGKVQNITDAEVIVAANGGSDLIYVPSKSHETVTKLVKFLSAQEYTGGLFVDDDYGSIPGSLPLSDIGLLGASPLPRPTVVINFRNFATNELDKVNSRVEFADTTLQQGQGMHGSLSRADTYNNVAAWGPDFRRNFVDSKPIANSDLAPTLAYLLNLSLNSNGSLQGRVLYEALRGAKDPDTNESRKMVSQPNEQGLASVLLYQRLGTHRYYDEACLVDFAKANSASNPCR